MIDRPRGQTRTRSAAEANPAGVAATCWIQPRRSVRTYSISLFQTRAMAGARSSSNLAATRSSTWSARSSVVGKVLGSDREAGHSAFNLRNNSNWTSWNSAPRVSGSICSSGTGCFARAELKNRLQQEAIRARRELLQRRRRVAAFRKGDGPSELRAWLDRDRPGHRRSTSDCASAGRGCAANAPGYRSLPPGSARCPSLRRAAASSSLQRCEIVLGVVDCGFGYPWARANPGAKER